MTEKTQTRAGMKITESPKFDIYNYHTVAIIGMKGTGKSKALQGAAMLTLPKEHTIAFDVANAIDFSLKVKKMTPEKLKFFPELYETEKKLCLDLHRNDPAELCTIANSVSKYIMDKPGKKSIFLDEIADVLPQDRTQPYAHGLARMARIGRNFGVTPIVLATQRPQDCNKQILALCDAFIFLRISYELDREVVRKLLRIRRNSFEEIEKTLMTLKTRECLIWAYDLPKIIKTKIRLVR